MSDGSVVTVGTFDGVHRGHRRVLESLVAEAGRRRLRSTLVTFEPHPLRVLRPAEAPRLLTSTTEKIEALAATGIDRVVLLRFDRALAALSPRTFIRELLIGRYGMRCLIMGYDHGFGRARAGDAASIRPLQRELGFDVVVVPPHEIGDRPVSSSRIRAALGDGDVAAAATALGRPYGLRGTVVRGDGRGSGLGFPTANLELDEPDKLLPAAGIYAVHAYVAGRRHEALLHLGARPAFGDDATAIEVHILDFDGDLYGRSLDLRLCARLRGVEAFASIDALVAAMHRDVAAGRAVFAGNAGACHDG
jgi:riboflavin kinase / FMN adenylyltransferase